MTSFSRFVSRQFDRKINRCMCHARERLVNIGIRPRVNYIKTRVCFLITRLMNNQIKGRRKATSQKEKKVKTKALWLLRKAYHNWVVYRKTRMHSFLKERKSFGETRCRKSCTQFKEFHSLSPRYVTRVSGRRKDHRLEQYKSNLLISELPTL